MDYTLFRRSAVPLRSLAIQATLARDAGIKQMHIYFCKTSYINMFLNSGLETTALIPCSPGTAALV